MQGLTLAFLACLALYAQAEQNGRAFALFNVIKFKVSSFNGFLRGRSRLGALLALFEACTLVTNFAVN